MTCIRQIKEILVSHGLVDPTVSEICADILNILGSQRHYIARSDFTERNREIMAGFRGNNFSEVADRFGLTERQIRRIVRQK